MRCIAMPWCRGRPYTPVLTGKVQMGWLCAMHYHHATFGNPIYVYPDLPLLEAGLDKR